MKNKTKQKQKQNKKKQKSKNIYNLNFEAPKDHGYQQTLDAFEKSISLLGLDYVDLYLIHWPGKQGVKSDSIDNKMIRRESWKAMEKIYKDGKAKAIGVSNYTISHLSEMLDDELCIIKPMVNQVELHPWYKQLELQAFCKQKGIHVQAYSSLGEGKICNNEEISEIAKQYNKTNAQILLKWALQQDISIIPKSCSETRILENRDSISFDLSEEDMITLNSFKDAQKICWDPSIIV